MPRYKVGVSWEMYGYVVVEADSVDDAVLTASDDPTISIPEGSYVEGSWVADADAVEEVD